MSAHTTGRLTAHKAVIVFENNVGGFNVSGCQAPEENARRIAACWNALDGISTEHLEQNEDGFRDMVIKTLNAYKETIAARKELAAVKALMEPFPTGGVDALARGLVWRAEAAGVVLTITQRPRLPPAMGNYDTVVEVRPVLDRSEKGGA